MATKKTEEKTEEITPQEYAKLRGITDKAVTLNLRNDWHLPGLISFKKFGRFYLLTVDKSKITKASK